MRIALIGSGPSGVYCFARLLAHPRPLSITIYEAGPTAGVGAPYSPALNHKLMLANIASIELPPVVDTLEEWLRGLPDASLQAMEIDRATIHARAFFPRVTLGAYYAAQFEQLVAQARAAGHTVLVKVGRRVLDVAARGDDVQVSYRVSYRATSSPRHALAPVDTETFAYAVVATGHQAPQRRPHATPGVALQSPYPATRAFPENGGALGVLGSSLSAIDVAVANAAAFGAFARKDGRLVYTPRPGVAFSIALMSRGGLIPEADFYCPIPYEPLAFCTQAAMPAIAGRPHRLDAAFALFRQELLAADPAYAAEIGLDRLTADTFADAYFARRQTVDPFVWAERNLAETIENHAQRRTVAWRYAILRMHESFGALAPALNAAERRRFERGLKRVFVDNYAAAPPESIERLLALHRAGVLAIVKLGPRYTIAPAPGGRAQVTAQGQRHVFNALVDARGQRALEEDDFPFPTLRVQMKANRLARAHESIAGEDPLSDIAVGADYRLQDGVNGVGRVHCISIPFLMGAQPFVQGLTSAAEMGATVAQSIRQRLDAAPTAESQAFPDVSSDASPDAAHGDGAALAALIEGVKTTAPIICLDSGVVIAHRPPARRKTV